MLVSVTVSGGSGSATFDAGGWGRDISVLSPDNTPEYDISVTNRRGDYLIGAENVRADTGEVVGYSTTKAKAEAAVRARYANESKRGKNW